MRILIDLQACQSTGSRHRGIGRYSLALARAMAKNAGQHDLHLMLSGSFADTIQPLRQEFADLLPQDRIHVWQVPAPVAELDVGNRWRIRAGELVREQALAELRPDIVHVSSLFEGLDDDALTSIGQSGEHMPTAVTLYDLIPLINANPYLENSQVRSWYYRKVQALKRADLLLAISESSRQEGINWLDLPAERVVNMSSAVDERFCVQVYPDSLLQALRQRYHLLRPFVMYTGGIDLRKNIEALICSFAALPGALRQQYQLAIVCSVQAHDRERLLKLAQQSGLAKDDVVLTGFVPDEDLPLLYYACALFVFPSWHEGFGLPALEAMACGAPVIAANTSSLPEVVGRADALFDPRSEAAITAKLHQGLSDEAYRSSLRAHGVQQAKKFSWDASAKVAMAAFEDCDQRRKTDVKQQSMTVMPLRKPRLAFFSPLPPAQSGIADYSAELLPELDRYYEIELIVNQAEVNDTWLTANFPVRDLAWFEAHAQCFDRIVYNVGNSPFHAHMFDLMTRYPGIVVLHDFYLSNIASHMEYLGQRPRGWAQALYESHGFSALREHAQTKDVHQIIWKYPCNFPVVDQALGVIVHSKYSIQLAQHWLGASVAQTWHRIPHLRCLPIGIQRNAARQALGVADDDFLLCAFGMLGPTKLNHQLLRVWLASPLAQDPRCHLVFVGQNDGGSYGAELLRAIKDSGLRRRIQITGFADAALFSNYLQAADLGVQLRTMARGETSGTVLDCMAHGMATIVNSNGTMAELPDDALVKLFDQFNDVELSLAIVTLWESAEQRSRLGAAARAYIRDQHAPADVGREYALAIEDFIQNASGSKQRRLLQNIARIDTPSVPEEADLCAISASISANRQQCGQKRLLVDVTVLAQVDPKSGIQRVVRAMLSELIAAAPDGFRVEPVVVCPQGLRYARAFTCKLFDFPALAAGDELVEVQNGDIFLGLDLSCEAVVRCKSLFSQLRRKGVLIYFVIYDILPMLKPAYFQQDLVAIFGQWLNTLVEVGDGVLCISRAVADELNTWLGANPVVRQGKFVIGSFHLGADIEASLPTNCGGELPANLQAALKKMPSLLMVGTLEPRKGHLQSLNAVEQLWAAGVEVCLVIVGGQGWKTEVLAERLRSHPEQGRRLFWMERCSDEILGKLYRESSGMLMSSEGEGFGLPLIEAARHQLPIIARDLPVFREIAGEHAYYFQGTRVEELCQALQQWLKMFADGQAAASDQIKWLTWEQSAKQLSQLLLQQNWDYQL